MIDLEDNKRNLLQIKEKIRDISQSVLNSEITDKKIAELENRTLQPGFWNDSKNASIILQEIKSLKDKKSKFTRINGEIDNLIELNSLLMIENDDELERELINNTKNIIKELEKLEIETLLSRKI